MIGKPTDCIPEGNYCYRTISIDTKTGRSKVKYCPYLSRFFDPMLNNRIPVEEDCYEAHIVPYCAYLEIDGYTSLLLWDQCKECGENLGDDE